jgi:hypothetical protein
MADDKKDAKKGGDKKDASPAPDLLGPVIGFLVVLVFLGYLLSGRNLSSGEDVPSWGELLSGERAPEGSPLNPDSGDDEAIEVGSRVVNREDAVVRLDLSGAAVAGEQLERAKGTVKEGPEEAFGRVWYFVDYEEAPDGWVESGSITPNVGTYTATHIVPIALDFLRPLFTALGITVALALVYLWWKRAQVEEVSGRLADAEYRAYLERTGRSAPAPVAAAASGKGDAPADLPVGDLELPQGWGTPLATPPRENERWAHIKTLIASASSSDWRQAVIEADIMLEEMLRAIGYDGSTIGDMLKNVDPADFLTLEEAWEAHKVRNQIAHRGLEFQLERNQAERTVGLYEKVFKEFNYL